MEEIVATLWSLTDDVENNRVEDTDAVDGVLTLGDTGLIDFMRGAWIQAWARPWPLGQDSLEKEVFNLNGTFLVK